MPTHNIEYSFTVPGKPREVFLFRFDPGSMQLVTPLASRLPEWTKLVHRRCPNCTLPAGAQERCPLAVVLEPILGRLEPLASLDSVAVRIVSPERTAFHRASGRQAIGSMLNLLTCASACPHFVYFRPMARFHLPFGVLEEKIHHAISRYLMEQYFRGHPNLVAEPTLATPSEIHYHVRLVFAAMGDRLRAVTPIDYMADASRCLDLYELASMWWTQTGAAPEPGPPEPLPALGC